MKSAILLFEQYQGKRDIGSSRIRGHWVIKHWPLAGEDIGQIETFKHGGKYDAVIYQKAYFVEHANLFKGVKIFDLCDPDWLDWGYRFKEMLEAVDAITCSSMALTKAVSKFTKKPVYFIPDRVDLTTLPEPKKHHGPTKKVVWYGYSHNFPMLHSCLLALEKRNLELIVVSDDVLVTPSSIKLAVKNYPWSDYWMRDVQEGDVVINPQSTMGKWKYKSDNKTSIAKALGMPVAHTVEELDQLLTEEQRIKARDEGLKLVKDAYDIKLSVIDYKEVIKEIQKTK